MYRLVLLNMASLLAAILSLAPLPVRSQAVSPGEVKWFSPEMVSGSFGCHSTDPAIVADQTGTVHLFWSETVGECVVERSEMQPGNAIAYSHWDGSMWSEPMDVLVSPDGGAIWQPVAAVDSTGLLHLIWASEFGALYYSHAYVSAASTAHGWLSPVELASGLPTLALPAALAVDSQQRVHVIYTSREPTQEVMHIVSMDGGMTWAWDQVTAVSAAMFLPPGAENLVSGGTVLTIDEADRLHVGWTMFNADGFGVIVFYAQSRNGGLSWSEPMVVDEKGPDDYEADWMNIATVGTDTIMLVWIGVGHPPGRSYRYSLDGGQTWTPPTHFMEGLVGETESPRMVVDSASTIHLLTPARRDTGDRTSGTRYLTWSKGFWSDPFLIPGPAGKERRYGGLRHTTTIRLGHEIFDAWFDEGLGAIWVVRGIVDAPVLDPLPFLKLERSSEEKDEEVAAPGPQATPSLSPDIPISVEPLPSSSDSDKDTLKVVLGGTLPAFLITLLVFFVYIRRKHVI